MMEDADLRVSRVFCSLCGFILLSTVCVSDSSISKSLYAIIVSDYFRFGGFCSTAAGFVRMLKSIISIRRVKEWANLIGRDAFNFSSETTGAQALQKVRNTPSSFIVFAASLLTDLIFVQAYKTLNVTVEDVDWHHALNNTKHGMNTFFREKAEALRVCDHPQCSFR